MGDIHGSKIHDILLEYSHIKLQVKTAFEAVT